jgi:hypothetical protein
MPTAAKMVAALSFGALAWLVSQMMVPLLTKIADPGWFAEINAAIGAVAGWRIAGPRAGTSLLGAVSYGLTTVVLAAFAALFLHSVVLMLRQAWRKLYDGPVEATVAVFDLMLKNGLVVATPGILASLIAGGILAGVLTEWAGRNFR